MSICLEAAELLEGDGVSTRVVSMPCFDRFLEQDAAYRDTVLPPSCRARVSVEAAATLGWERWVGPDGESVGMNGFGASAPQKDLLRALRLHGRERGREGQGGRGARRRGGPELRRRHGNCGTDQRAPRGAHRGGHGVWLDQIRRSLIE